MALRGQHLGGYKGRSFCLRAKLLPTMGDPIMDAFLGWEDRETVFTFDFPVELPYTQISPILPCIEPLPSVEDVPDLIPDCEPVAQDAIAKLTNLVGELLSRVAILEAQ